MSSKEKPPHYSDEHQFTVNQAVEITRGSYIHHKGIVTKVALLFHILLANGVHIQKTERGSVKAIGLIPRNGNFVRCK